jgi:hypothetical protein
MKEGLCLSIVGRELPGANLSVLSLQKKNLLETRKVAQNVDDAIETLQNCLRVLDMANRVDGLIEDKKYYSALRVSGKVLMRRGRE